MHHKGFALRDSCACMFGEIDHAKLVTKAGCEFPHHHN